MANDLLRFFPRNLPLVRCLCKSGQRFGQFTGEMHAIVHLTSSGKTSFHQNTHGPPLHKSIQSFIDNFYQAFRDESYAKGFPVWLHLLKLSPLSPPPHWTPTPCTAWSPPSPLSWSFSCLQNFPLPQKASWKDGSAPQRTFVVNRA